MDAVTFLAALYESAPPGSGVIELRALKNAGGFDRREFTAPLGFNVNGWSVEDQIRNFSDRYRATSTAAAYYGVALRKPGSTTGKKTDVSVITALWADVDVVKMGWDMDRTLGMIKAHELRPSVIVNSGNGLHLYWVLKEPLELDHSPAWGGTPDDGIEVAEQTMKRLAEVFKGDKTADVTRVLRLPGTWNTKDGKAKQVKVVMADWHEYDLDELDERSQATDNFIDKSGWINREQMKARVKAEREAAWIMVAEQTVGRQLGLPERRLSWDQIWGLTKYRGETAGLAFIGLDEAILRATARLYATTALTDEQIIERVLFRVHEIKQAQAPHEHWDWNAERREVADKLVRFKTRWKEYHAGRVKGRR